MEQGKLRINAQRLDRSIQALAKLGALDGGGVCRLALTDEDKLGRDWVVSQMRSMNMTVEIDQIGNIIGTRKGREGGPPVMTGSHIDTVRTGGLYDGNLGVLAGLEVVATLNDAAIETQYPLAVTVFTNEEGARFAPDMMGSLVFVGGLDVNQALDTLGIDGTSVRENLERIGYKGDLPCGAQQVRAFVECHIEQGPILDAEGCEIGSVEGVQGISWRELTVRGSSNHAGTTPMHMRVDAGNAAFRIAQGVRQIALDMGGHQLSTVGHLKLFPNLVNVIPNKAVLMVDLRNFEEHELLRAEQKLEELIVQVQQEECVSVSSRSLARFEPVIFDTSVMNLIQRKAEELGFKSKRIISGAGHDAGLLARICPAAIIFVPSVGGISHNVKEFTRPEDVEAGANVLLQSLLELLNP